MDKPLLKQIAEDVAAIKALLERNTQSTASVRAMPMSPRIEEGEAIIPLGAGSAPPSSQSCEQALGRAPSEPGQDGPESPPPHPDQSEGNP